MLSIKTQTDFDAIPVEWCAIASEPVPPILSPFSRRHPLPLIMADLRTVNELIAGSVGGAAQVLVGQPLDTIKTRAQIAPRECRLDVV